MSNTQRPEGALIGAARRKKGLSANKAAKQAGMSAARWRQIENGYASAGPGNTVDVRGPADTVARMAEVVGLTPDALRETGRTDAADAMVTLHEPPLTVDEQTEAIQILLDTLHPGLAEFTDDQLLSEINVRMGLTSLRLQQFDQDAAVIEWGVDVNGHRVVTSRPNWQRR